MIHILTVHYKSLDWIPIQHKYLENNLKNYQVWSFIDEVEFNPWPFDFNFHSSKKSKVFDKRGGAWDHAKKLDILVKNIKAVSDNDIILFLDGDSFPISPLNKFIENTLADYDFISIVREEMGHKFPHPSFACCKLDLWKKHNLTWGVKFDTGGVLQKQLEDKNIKWKKIKRTQSLGSHPVMFGVYGDIIYHHTAAFREATTRWDIANENLTKPVRDRELESRNIFEKIKNNELFKV